MVIHLRSPHSMWVTFCIAAMFGIREMCARGSDLFHRCFISLASACLALRKILMAPLVPFTKQRLGANGCQLGLLLLCLGVGSVIGIR